MRRRNRRCACWPRDRRRPGVAVAGYPRPGWSGLWPSPMSRRGVAITRPIPHLSNRIRWDRVTSRYHGSFTPSGPATSSSSPRRVWRGRSFRTARHCDLHGGALLTETSKLSDRLERLLASKTSPRRCHRRIDLPAAGPLSLASAVGSQHVPVEQSTRCVIGCGGDEGASALVQTDVCSPTAASADMPTPSCPLLMSDPRSSKVCVTGLSPGRAVLRSRQQRQPPMTRAARHSPRPGR